MGNMDDWLKNRKAARTATTGTLINAGASPSASTDNSNTSTMDSWLAKRRETAGNTGRQYTKVTTVGVGSNAGGSATATVPSDTPLAPGDIKKAVLQKNFSTTLPDVSIRAETEARKA